ncbi:DUF222 domain-containing protein [Microlunatus parietis]
MSREAAEELTERICAQAARQARDSCELLILIGEFDAGNGWAWCNGFRSVAHWLAWTCSMTQGTAREHVRVARALRRMPAVTAAFGAGELSYAKVREVTRIVDLVDEAQLCTMARHATASQLARMISSFRAAAGTRIKTEARRQFRLITRDDDTMTGVTGRLPAEEAAIVTAALHGPASSTAPLPARRSTATTRTPMTRRRPIPTPTPCWMCFGIIWRPRSPRTSRVRTAAWSSSRSPPPNSAQRALSLTRCQARPGLALRRVQGTSAAPVCRSSTFPRERPRHRALSLAKCRTTPGLALRQARGTSAAPVCRSSTFPRERPRHRAPGLSKCRTRSGLALRQARGTSAAPVCRSSTFPRERPRHRAPGLAKCRTRSGLAFRRALGTAAMPVRRRACGPRCARSAESGRWNRRPRSG